MNFYKLFYWISVADKLGSLLTWFSISTGIALVITVIGYFVSSGYCSSEIRSGGLDQQSTSYREWDVWRKIWKTTLIISIIFFSIFSIANVALPSKNDSLLIVAGGAVGNFIVSDSSSRQIPSELTLLVRQRLKEEIQNVSLTGTKDTLISKSKEELMEIIKNKK